MSAQSPLIAPPRGRKTEGRVRRGRSEGASVRGCRAGVVRCGKRARRREGIEGASAAAIFGSMVGKCKSIW